VSWLCLSRAGFETEPRPLLGKGGRDHRSAGCVAAAVERMVPAAWMLRPSLPVHEPDRVPNDIVDTGDFQDEIECLGIEASPSFVREPEGNGVAERFIRTSHGEVQVKGVVLG
jgi:hypothetical protein